MTRRFAVLSMSHCGNATITSIKILNSVSSIPENAFKDCINLTSVDLSEATSLKTIGRSAFENTSITQIEFPDNLEIIYEDAFRNCQKLRNICFRKKASKIKEIKKYAFLGCENLVGIRIPHRVINIYGQTYVLSAKFNPNSLNALLKSPTSKIARRMERINVNNVMKRMGVGKGTNSTSSNEAKGRHHSWYRPK